MVKRPPPDNPALLLHELLRRDFAAFARKAWAWVSAGEPIAWNWHLDAIAYQLERVAKGENLRLMVTIPPRNAKSKTISVIWVAWMLGQNPKLNFVGVSYSNELSGKLARDCLSIIQSPWYRELFPRTIISAKRSAAMDFETTVGGSRLATSVTGTLTGRGGDIIILDDVIKPDEATSETTREAVNNWYQSTLASRLNDKNSGAIILVMQRLHQYDLAGMLLEAGGWEQLKIPAIAVEDETIPLTRGRVHHRKASDLLHPASESQQVLDNQKASMGSLAFAAQYQQDPVPEVGNIVRREWFKRFDLANFQRSPGTVIQSWDTASKDNPHNDWSVCVTAVMRGRDIYIIDVFRKRMQMPELRATASSLAAEYRPTALLIEDQASGTQLLQLLRMESNGPASSPIGRHPDSDKVSRALGMSAMIESGRLFLPKDAAWLAEFEAELIGFPNSRFDDQVDALSQLMGWIRQNDAIDPPMLAGPILFWTDDFGVSHSSEDEDYGEWGQHEGPWIL
ncbi:MAG: phage terminase large subunit [Novosphingobium sp.]